jgi:outer membrane protein with beta-barrel domain
MHETKIIHMKRTKKVSAVVIAAIAGTILSIPARAQFKPGTLMVGTTIGSTAYSSSNSDYTYDNGSGKSTSTNTYTFGIGPQIGVFVSPNVVVGATLSFNLSTGDTKSTTTATNLSTTGSKTNTTTTSVSLGPFLRYYFAGVPGKNWFFMQVNGAAGTGTGSSSGNGYASTTTNTTNGKVTDIFNWNAGGSVGLTHFFYKHIGMDFSLGYSYSHAHSNNANTTYTTKNTGVITSSTNNYGLSTGTNGVTLGVGFHWFI